jgi:hypothetical protein
MKKMSGEISVGHEREREKERMRERDQRVRGSVLHKRVTALVINLTVG